MVRPTQILAYSFVEQLVILQMQGSTSKDKDSHPSLILSGFKLYHQIN